MQSTDKQILIVEDNKRHMDRGTRQRQLFLQHRWKIQNYTPMHIYIAISILINITEKMNSKKQFSLLLKITQRKRKENIFILKQMVLYAR